MPGPKEPNILPWLEIIEYPDFTFQILRCKMRVNHCHTDIRVSEQLLESCEIIGLLNEKRCKRMTIVVLLLLLKGL